MKNLLILTARCGFQSAKPILYVCVFFLTQAPVSMRTSAYAEVLATNSFSTEIEVTASALVAENMALTLRNSSAGSLPGDPRVEIFDDLLVPDDAGQTFTITAADDQDFSAMVQLLTNGIDNNLEFEFRGTVQSSTESQYFSFAVGSGPDLHGYEITDVSVTVDELRFRFSGNIFDGSLRRFLVFDSTMTINGFAVPEPTSLAVLVAVGMSLRRRRSA